MHVCRKRVRESVEGQGRLVRNDAYQRGPEPYGDQFLMLAGREVGEPVDAPTYSNDSACPHVLEQELR